MLALSCINFVITKVIKKHIRFIDARAFLNITFSVEWRLSLSFFAITVLFLVLILYDVLGWNHGISKLANFVKCCIWHQESITIKLDPAINETFMLLLWLLLCFDSIADFSGWPFRQYIIWNNRMEFGPKLKANFYVVSHYQARLYSYVFGWMFSVLLKKSKSI